jgi:hypothetical protein
VEHVIIAKMGVEGGGVMIYGRRTDGTWLFWQEGSSMHLDENDDEDWRSWESELSNDLSTVVPENWPLMYPVQVHPEFVGWFRDHYEASRAGLREDLRSYQARHPDRNWQRIFGDSR